MSKSHLISKGRLADELAKAGHDVTVLELDFLQISQSINSVKLAKRQIIGDFRHGAEFKSVISGFSSSVMDDSSFIDELQNKWAYHNTYHKLCAELLERDELFQELKNQNFDGFFAEHVNLCGIAYAQALGIQRKFLISSCTFTAIVYEYTGLSMPLSVVPVTTDLSMEPTWYERARNLLAASLLRIEYQFLNGYLREVFQNKFGQVFPSIYDIVSNVDVVFIATDEIIDISTTTLHNIVHVGGLGLDTNIPPLDTVFSAEMEKGSYGVVYFSLGTVANTTKLDSKVMENVLAIVKKFPELHFLIRADKYDVKTREKAKFIPNVFVSDWLPQPAILNHPRLKLFITHSGYNSIVEAARAGVPLINIPFMFDQNLNSRSVEKKGWGVRRHKRQLLDEPEAIEEDIREVINNKKYKEKAERMKNLIKSKPMSPSQLLVKTTEWAIQNKGLEELKFVSRSESTRIFYNLDVILPILVILSLVVLKVLKSCFVSIFTVGKLKVE